MKYELTISARQPNPEYAKWARSPYKSEGSPMPYLHDREVTVTLTEAEYRKVKVAIVAALEIDQ